MDGILLKAFTCNVSFHPDKTIGSSISPTLRTLTIIFMNYYFLLRLSFDSLSIFHPMYRCNDTWYIGSSILFKLIWAVYAAVRIWLYGSTSRFYATNEESTDDRPLSRWWRALPAPIAFVVSIQITNTNINCINIVFVTVKRKKMKIVIDVHFGTQHINASHDSIDSTIHIGYSCCSRVILLVSCHVSHFAHTIVLFLNWHSSHSRPAKEYCSWILIRSRSC